MNWSIRALLLAVLVVIGLPAIASDVDQAREEFWLGNDAYQEGDYPSAVAHFEAAYQLAPNARVQEYLGRTYVAMRRYPEAVRAFERAIEDDPSLAEEVGAVLDGVREDMNAAAFGGARAAVQAAIAGALGESPAPESQLRAGLGTTMSDVTVQVLSEPRGAEVFVDGTEFGSFGVTPLEIRLFTGPHRIEVRKPWHAPEARVVNIAIPGRGQSIPTVAFRLERLEVPVEVRATPVTARMTFVSEGGERVDLGMGVYSGVLPAGPGTILIQSAGRDRRVDVVVEPTESGDPRQFEVQLDGDAAQSNRIAIRVGTLEVVSQVEEGVVTVAGQQIGDGPGTFSIDLIPGPHIVRVERQGHEPFEQTVDIRADGVATIYVNQLERERRRR